MKPRILALVASGSLVAGAVVSAPIASADSIPLPSVILVSAQMAEDGVYFSAEAQEDLPAMVAEETLLVDYSSTARVKFRMVAGAKMLAFASDGADLKAICETQDGFHLYQPTSELTCYVTPGSGAVLSPSRRTEIDLSAATKATNTLVIDGAIAPGNAYPAVDVIGGAGADYVQGGKANDIMRGGPGDDSLFGGHGRDDLSGDEGNDDIDGEEGEDSMSGNAGDDYVVGGPDPDIILGGTGIDTVDAEDGIADTRVDCQNEPGQGKVFFDRDLDLPYDCPVELLPTEPTKVTVGGTTKKFTVDWAPPVFDGNSAIVSYHVELYRGGWPLIVDQVDVDADQSSADFENLAPSRYFAVVYATNAVGDGPAQPSSLVTVSDGPSAPIDVQSSFVSFAKAKLSWAAPPGTDVTGYEIALRVRDKKDRKWGSWATLPDKTGAKTTSVNFGPDLKFVKNRRYQFRVRTLSGKEASPWSVSPVRFAAAFNSPKVVKSYYVDWVLNVKTELGPAKVLAYNDIVIKSISGEVIGYPNSLDLATFTRPSPDRLNLQISPMFGDEDHQECKFVMGYDSAGEHATTSFTTRCYLES